MPTYYPVGGGGGGAVSSVSNYDGTLTVYPTTGAVIATLNLTHVNVWSAAQTFGTINATTINTSTLKVTTGAHVGYALVSDASGNATWQSVGFSAVSSVSNSDGTLNVSPTTGAVIASLNLGKANTWSTKQTFPSIQLTTGASNGYILVSDSSGNASWAPGGGGGSVTSVVNSDGTLTISPTTGSVVAALNLGNSNTWTVTQNFTNINLYGSPSTGYITTITRAISTNNQSVIIPDASGYMAFGNLAILPSTVISEVSISQTYPSFNAGGLGYGSSGTPWVLTPSIYGTVRIHIDGWVDLAATGIGGNYSYIQLCYGTGTPPQINTPAAGTIVGGGPIVLGFDSTGITSFSALFPFSLDRIITGLTPRTTYWFDVQTCSSTGIVNILDITFDALELPY